MRGDMRWQDVSLYHASTTPDEYLTPGKKKHVLSGQITGDSRTTPASRSDALHNAPVIVGPSEIVRLGSGTPTFTFDAAS